MQEIRKHICSEQTVIPAQEINYLSFIDEGRDENGFQKMGIQQSRNLVQLETYTIKAEISKSQIRDMEALYNMGMGNAIDPLAMMKSALMSEDSNQQESLITKMIRFAGEQHTKEGYTKFQMFCHNWFGYTPKDFIKADGELINKLISASNKINSATRKRGADFILVGPSMNARITNLAQFVFRDPNQSILEQGTGEIYQTGTLSGRFQVLVDPKIKWDDETIILGSDTNKGEEGIYHLFMETKFTESESFSEAESDLKIIINLIRRMALIATDNAHCKYYTLETTTKRHNLFTHFLNKLLRRK